MGIWFQECTVKDFNQRGINTLVEFLGITFTEVGEDSLTAIMPVDERTRQPMGILHGGANVVLAETIASTAANAVIDLEKYYCVGLDINANHIRSVREGFVTGVARALHLGRTTQVWTIDIRNEAGQLTCVSRMTASVVSRSR
jgi:1,4-dihydroxy-2-naphthoyl-CoA hydrolase